MGNENNPPPLMQVHQGANHLYLGNVGIGIPPYKPGPPSGLTVAGDISARGTVATTEGVISPNYVFSNNYLGTWSGETISGSKVSMEGIDIKSTGVPDNLYLKATGDGTVQWDIIENDEIFFDNHFVDGDLTVVGDIIEYSSNGVVYSKTSVFTKPLISGSNTLRTFRKEDFKTAKYVISLVSGANRTACEILVAHNGTNAEGTTYGIVDCQVTSLLTDITVSVGVSTIDLIITASSDCTATVNGVAHY
jgi:hypothetical protein|tara:strand:+ start:132 stop:878 length:747 start_codon:yes stop_codon:yes gene_type:complete